MIQIFESTSNILRPVLGGSEGRFRKGVVVAYPWSGVRGFDSEPVEHRQNGGRFKRGAVIAVQDGFGLICSDSLGKSGSLNDADGMLGIVRFMHLPANDFAAVDIENQVQIKPASCCIGGQVRHIPAPELTGSVSDVGRCGALLFGLLGATTVSVLTLGAQHSAKGRFTGDVNSLIGQRWDDACRRSISKAGLVGFSEPGRVLRA